MARASALEPGPLGRAPSAGPLPPPTPLGPRPADKPAPLARGWGCGEGPMARREGGERRERPRSPAVAAGPQRAAARPRSTPTTHIPPGRPPRAGGRCRCAGPAPRRAARAPRPALLPPGPRPSRPQHPETVHQGPHRQPGRDRGARHPRVQRARPRDGRGLLDGRRRLPPRPAGGRSGVHRGGALVRVVPVDPQHHLGGDLARRGRDSPGRKRDGERSGRRPRAAPPTPPRPPSPLLSPLQGYGFLSENATFVDICADHGIEFIGPRSEHIRTMGDKSTARDTMKAAGVPTVPGSDGLVKTESEAVTVARQVRRKRGGGEGRSASSPRPPTPPPPSPLLPGRLPRHDQGDCRRRRARHAPRDDRGRVRAAAPGGAAGSGSRVWQRRRLPRALRPKPAPHRVPGRGGEAERVAWWRGRRNRPLADTASLPLLARFTGPGRQARQRHPPGRARLLHPAPQPEAARGGAVARAD